MIPILDAISNNAAVSVLPAAGSSAQTAARSGCGFASTLASAEGLYPNSNTATSEVEGSGTVRKTASAPPNLGARAQTLGDAERQKGPSPRTKLGVALAGNIVVPELIAASVIQVPFSPQPGAPQANTPQLDLLPSNFVQPPNFAQTNGTSTQSPTAAVQFADVLAGSIQQVRAYGAATQSSTPYSVTSQTGGGLDRLTGSAVTAVSLPGSRTGVVPNADVEAHAQGAAINNVPTALSTATQSPTIGATLLPSPELGGQTNVLQDELRVSGTELAERMQSADASMGTGQTPPVLPNASSRVQEVAALRAGSELESTGAELSTGRADSAVPTSNLLASAAGNEAPAVSTDLQSGEDSTANVMTANASVQPGLAVARIENPLPGIDPQVASTISNAPGQLSGARSTARFLPPRGADVVTTSNVKEGGSGEPLASQTPFSVFFSGPGPGAESAASTLPRMTFPVTGPAGRDNHAAIHDEMSASPQMGFQQSGSTHNAIQQNIKDSSTVASSGSVSGNGTLQAGQPLRREMDLSAANGQSAATPAGIGPASVSATSAMVALPLAGSATPVVDTLPKASTTPGAPGGTANMVPATPDPPAAMVPGPVQMAQLMNRLDQSEMRIGMNTSAFGSVEVRAVVHASDVGLVVGSEKGDLRALLASDMPVLANTLQEQNLRLHSVNFMQGFAFSNHASGGGDGQPRQFVPQGAAPHIGLPETAVEESREAPAGGEFSGGDSSLSILA